MEDYRSPRRFEIDVAAESPARVLDCASPLALWRRLLRRRRAFHELSPGLKSVSKFHLPRLPDEMNLVVHSDGGPLKGTIL